MIKMKRFSQPRHWESGEEQSEIVCGATSFLTCSQWPTEVEAEAGIYGSPDLVPV